jgi:hypothetical protein
MRYEASDEVFVAMPFTADFERAYDTVIKPAIETVSINSKNLRPRIINRGTTGSPDIHEQIFEAIIHSRMVIADMTVQSNYTDNNGAIWWQPNANVAYEVGLATTWRNPEDILLIHQKHQEHSYSFDIQNLRHVSYETGNPDSVQLIADEIVRAINRSRFLAEQTYSKIIQSLSPTAIQFMHQESQRTFPVIAFKKIEMGIIDCRIHAATELLSCGALKNRNVIPQGSSKGVAVVYQWTELGLRMMLSIRAINQERRKELTNQIASVPKDSIPPQEMLNFPKSEIVPVETKVKAPQEVKKKE